jgi:lactase-phlorizin hydrolase
LAKVPLGLRKLLSYIKKNYGDPEIYITENGWSEKGEDQRVGEAALNDTERVGYYTEYINEALKATLLDGVNLKGMPLCSVRTSKFFSTTFKLLVCVRHKMTSFPLTRQKALFTKVKSRSCQLFNKDNLLACIYEMLKLTEST